MRSGGEPTSVLWGDTAATSISPPLPDRPCNLLQQQAVPPSETAMNCFEGLPSATHHHHAIHHHPVHHQPHVIQLLPHSAPATPPTTPNLASSPPPDDGQYAPCKAPSPPGLDVRVEDVVEPSTARGSTSSPTLSAASGHDMAVQVKVEEDAKDDSGISPGSGAERTREGDPPSPRLDGDCPSPSGSSNGGRGGASGVGGHEDGARSPYSEGCYSEGCDEADLRRMQPEGGGDAATQRADAASDDEDTVDVHKPRITSQGKFKTFRCKQCDFVALTKLEFWEHSRMHIRAERLLTCPRCPFVTEYKHHLEYHLRNHFGSKPFKCPHCPYTCVNKSMLNSHLKSHSSVYQYRCADCGYATKYCHSLKLHLRKYSHQPAMVLHPDGSPNPLPVIDVYGTRRGPKSGGGGKKCPSQPEAAPTTPPAASAAATTPSGHAFGAYPSPTFANGGATALFGTPLQPQHAAAYSATPQTSRPPLPPRGHLPAPGGAEEQWPREEQVKRAAPALAAGNRPVKCTLCEFASTSREAFAEHMMAHAANGDVGPRDGDGGATKAPSGQGQPPPLLVANGFASQGDAGLKEYLARMLTAVVPRMGGYRGPVPAQLQAQWHAHVQQQMQQQQVCFQQQQQTANGGSLQHGPQHPSATASPQPIQRPWVKAEEEEEDEEEEEVASQAKGGAAGEGAEPQRPPGGGGVPLDLTKDGPPRVPGGPGGSSRRKGRAFKLERISRSLQRRHQQQGDADGSHSEGPSEEEDEDSSSSLDSSSKRGRRRQTPAAGDETPRAPKVPRVKEDKEDYHCPYCDIAFRDVVLYTMHMGYHGYQDPFKCNMCGQETNDKVSFFLHIARSSHS